MKRILSLVLVLAGFTFATLPAFAQSSQADPCQSSAVAKRSVVIAASGVATTQLVALQPGMTVYVCGYSFTVAGSATATATLEYGTGSSCGTGTTTVTGAYLGGTLAIHIQMGGAGTITKTASANALCLVAGGSTPSIQGVLTYVQQ
jgi:hypothetical protein